MPTHPPTRSEYPPPPRSRRQACLAGATARCAGSRCKRRAGGFTSAAQRVGGLGGRGQLGLPARPKPQRASSRALREACWHAWSQEPWPQRGGAGKNAPERRLAGTTGRLAPQHLRHRLSGVWVTAAAWPPPGCGAANQGRGAWTREGVKPGQGRTAPDRRAGTLLVGVVTRSAPCPRVRACTDPRRALRFARAR